MKKLLFLLLLPLLLSGCAAIVGDNAEAVYINSTPAGARFVITDSDSFVVASGITPQSVILSKSDGSYFGKRQYTLTLKQEGYYSATMPLEYRLSHWYTFGNIIFFGVPGWLIVDPFFGGMYTLKADRLNIGMRLCAPGPYRDMCS